MTHAELETATNLVLVRQVKYLLELLDPSVGPLIPDEEHAQARRTVRKWEQALQDAITLRKERKDKVEHGDMVPGTRISGVPHA